MEVIALGTASVPIGTLPPLGEVPETMLAQVVRQDRFGDPSDAFRIEEIPVPKVGPEDVLVAVMATGINFNNVWAARGIPIDVIAVRQRTGEPWDFHAGGSDASGIVYAIGEKVTHVAIGDEVIVHPGWWETDDPWVLAGKDPMIAPSSRIWGYETNFGSFCQFAIAREHQVLPKAPRLSWEEAAAPNLVGMTAYRMLHGWRGNAVQKDDIVLVWGGSGGVGIQAIQLAKAAGAHAVAVVSDDDRGEYSKRYGAIGYINRNEFEHWGIPPHWTDAAGQKEWTGAARDFGRRIWDIVGERRSPAIVIEHPGEATIPTSIFVCERGGMVVVCAGTTGYSATVDLRYHWVQQKRLQGSHGTNDEQAAAFNRLITDGTIDPAVGEVLPFEGIAGAHHDMGAGVNVFGNRVALIGASERGLGADLH
jgi:crotonyl-CoA carboxylase/reductase